MRLATVVILAAAATCALIAIAVPEAAAQDTGPLECSKIYNLARGEQGRLKVATVDRDYESLLNFIGNARDIDFDKRFDAFRDKFPDNDLVQGAAVSGGATAERMRVEGFFAHSEALLAPERTFTVQYQVFAHVRACDVAHGMKPVLDVAMPLADVVKHYHARTEKKIAADDAHRNSIDHKDCAVLFWVGAALSQSNPQTMHGYQQRINVAAKMHLDVNPGMTQQRLAEVVQREGVALAGGIKTKEDMGPVVEDMNTCEIRYGMSLSAKP